MDDGRQRINLSVAVRHHPVRAHLLPDLLERLGPKATVPMNGDLSRWGSGRRALLAYDPNATHHLVIEDDAIVPRHLLSTVRYALRFVPAGHPMGLYMGAPGVDDPYVADALAAAESAGASWLRMPAPMSGVGIVFPTEHVYDLVYFGDDDDEVSYDGRIARWYAMLGVHCWHTWPCLVDHRWDVPSLTEGKMVGRQSARYVGADARAFDPTGPVVDAG